MGELDVRPTDERPLAETTNRRPDSAFAFGVGLIVLGAIAMMTPTLAAVLGTLFLGGIVFASGVVRFIEALDNRGAPSFTWQLLEGILAAAAGALFVIFPGIGMVTITMLLGTFLVVGGVLKIILGIQYRRTSGWGWLCFSGLVTTALGWILLSRLPVAATWALGIIIGVDLIVEGASMIGGASMGAGAGRRVPVWREHLTGR